MVDLSFIWQLDPISQGVIASLIATSIVSILIVINNIIDKRARIRYFWGRITKDFTLISGQIYLKENPQYRYMAAGDIKAIMDLTLVIQDIFKLKKIPHRFSDALSPREDLNTNILTVGGPKFNYVTKRLIDEYELRPGFPAKFEGNDLILHWFGPKKEEKTKYLRYIKTNNIIDDYGLIIRSINPFDSSRKSVSWVIAGSGNNGCRAAADQLSQFIYRSKFSFWNKINLLGKGELGLVIVKAKFLEGEYASFEPLFYASYYVKRYPFFWKKEKAWSYIYIGDKT